MKTLMDVNMLVLFFTSACLVFVRPDLAVYGGLISMLWLVARVVCELSGYSL